MQLFRPSNECYEQSYNHQSSIKPFFGIKPAAGYGGSNLAQCQTQTQTQCFESQLPGAAYGKPHHAAADAGGYGMQHAAGGAQGYSYSAGFSQKPFGQYSQHGSYGSNGSAHQGSYGSAHQGSYGSSGSAHQGSYGSSGSALQGSYGSSGSALQGSYGSSGSAHHGSYGSMKHGGYGLQQHGSFAAGYGNTGLAHHGSFGSGCEAPASGYSYSMKKKKRRSSWRTRSGDDSDKSGSDESGDEKC